MLILVFPFFLFDLFGLDFLLGIILDSLIVAESLSLQSVLELEYGFLLHGVGHLIVKNHVGDNASLDYDTFVVQVNVEVLLHTGRMLLSSEVVGLSGLYHSGHGPHSLHDVGINGLVDLGYVRDQLLHVV